MLKNCFDDRLVFVSNTLYRGYSRCYVVLLDSTGEQREVPIDRCPWCGDEIRVRKIFYREGEVDAPSDAVQ